MSKRELPTHFCCPISLELMRDPVITFPGGITFERRNLLEAQKFNKLCPLSRQEIREMAPNRALKQAIDQWLQENSDFVEEMPSSKKIKRKESREILFIQNNTTILIQDDEISNSSTDSITVTLIQDDNLREVYVIDSL